MPAAIDRYFVPFFVFMCVSSFPEPGPFTGARFGAPACQALEDEEMLRRPVDFS
jgi:hypothetical protein